MISLVKFPKSSYTGWGSLGKINNELESMDIRNLLIVLDPALEKLEFTQTYLPLIHQTYNTTIYTDIEPEPSIGCAQRLVDFTRKGNFELVIGIGGGSTLDLAKLTSVISYNEGNVIDYLNLTGTKTFKTKGIPKILIPTTSGTGSEATDISVLSLDQTKDVISHDYLLADIAIIDPQLTLSVPQRVTAATGVDALTHAIEAYLSVNSNAITDALAIQAIKLIGKSLNQAVYNAENQEARTDMSYGSYLAGLAFNNAGVGAIHALAYPLGNQFKLPHGESNAVLLPYVLNYISDSCNSKLETVTKLLVSNQDTNPSKNYLEFFRKIVGDIGLPTTLKQYGIKLEHLLSLTEEACKQKRLLSRTPANLSEDDIYDIYKTAHEG
ncbi:iron-containing alcohol dehydrogenase [Litchfieldia alkalitelluris]|uniref:iron-containing alcohol dehydrogenase n=1 Tax=Litchfieldia alkalitelluris TaxID=304268 RepID=UPI0009962004|nr:iron-containing alcohol dehydrogenase [Litchfieldia alkalitelluris]